MQSTVLSIGVAQKELSELDLEDGQEFARQGKSSVFSFLKLEDQFGKIKEEELHFPQPLQLAVQTLT